MFFFSKPALRVLFICTANVCRSPLAEGLLRQALRERGLRRQIEVKSAGTQVASPGRRPDPRIKKLAQLNAVSLSGIKAKQVGTPMLVNADYILVMDYGHLRELAALSPNQQLPEAVALLGKYLMTTSDGPEEIRDPYFGSAHCFATVYEQIAQAVAHLADELQMRCDQR